MTTAICFFFFSYLEQFALLCFVLKTALAFCKAGKGKEGGGEGVMSLQFSFVLFAVTKRSDKGSTESKKN